MTSLTDDEGKRRNIIRSLEEAREDLRVNGPVPVADVQRLFDDLDAQLSRDEDLKRHAERAHSNE